MKAPILIRKVPDKSGIKNTLQEISREYADVFPSDRRAKVFLKPNLNSNMNALTGNTTDLRLIAFFIEILKDLGYRDITIGDGTNSGYYRNRINVMTRLKVNEVAGYYGIKVVDLNYSAPVYLDFENGVKAAVARECVEADMLVNLPKLKTHFEMGMSVCLKNLMGCLVGQENKKKAHQSLARNIMRINDRTKPQLHIVDGLIAMEGLGPTRGTPVKMGIIVGGTDPYLIDLACAKIATFPYEKVPVLKAAEEMGKITRRHHSLVAALDMKEYQRRFAPPEAGFLARFIHHPVRQKYFLAIRNTRVFRFLCSTKIGGKILYSTGLRQDVFMEGEMQCEKISVDWKKCTRCGKCKDYCPLSKNLPDALSEEKECIHCLYCYLVCPERAIIFEGRLGFVAEQIRQYDEIVRKVT